MDDVLRRSRTTGQAPGQSVGVLTSLPASGLPGLLELNHTVPASPSHPTLHPYRAIHRAHGGPPDSVELLQCVGRTCHGLMILISDTTGKSLPGRLGVSKQCCCASRDGTRMPQSQPGRSQGGHCSERRGRMGPPAGALRATSRISQRVRRLGAALLILLMAASRGRVRRLRGAQWDRRGSSDHGRTRVHRGHSDHQRASRARRRPPSRLPQDRRPGPADHHLRPDPVLRRGGGHQGGRRGRPGVPAAQRLLHPQRELPGCGPCRCGPARRSR